MNCVVHRTSRLSLFLHPNNFFVFVFQELEEFCFRFALNHMTEVAQTEAFMALDELTVKNFIQRAAQHGAFKY